MMAEEPYMPEGFELDYLRRALPQFAKYLDDNGDGTRGDGFAAFEDQMRREEARDPSSLKPNEALFRRLYLGLSLAVVEVSTAEFKKGIAAVDLIAMVPRALGAIVVYATASAMNDEVNYRSLAKVFIEEFKFGAKEAADQLSEHREAKSK